ncbi:mediator of RNA polymerase II transcription subunit 26 [Amia ocellicauda]|uniref:mediator of RNA polymerase II transcription subunit 26 n=1 Tax=Amia ocellicauda TaxID=2972642 RepID=UPI003464A087
MAMLTRDCSSPQQMKDLLLQSIDRDANVINMERVLEVISVLEDYPITKEALEETRLGKYINNLRKKTLNQELSRRAKKLVKSWREIALTEQEPAPAGKKDSSQKLWDKTVLRGKEAFSKSLAEALLSRPVDSDNRNVPPSVAETPLVSHHACVKVEETGAGSLDVIPSPTPKSTGLSSYRHFVREVPLQRDGQRSPSSGFSIPRREKPQSQAKVYHEPGSLETISPASCSTPPHSPTTTMLDYSPTHSLPLPALPVSHNPAASSPQISTVGQQRVCAFPTEIHSSASPPTTQSKSPALSRSGSVEEGKSELKSKPKRGRKKGSKGRKDCSSHLLSQQLDPGPGKIKERRITYDALTGQIVLATPKKSVCPRAEPASLPLQGTDSIAELKERNLQIWDSVNKADWKELAKNKIIQKYFSSQCERLSISRLETQEYIEQLQDIVPQDSSTSKAHQPWVVLPTEPSSRLSGIHQEASAEDLDAMHNRYWPGVNGCYDNKGNWYNWAQCISLEPYQSEGKLHILPYVCLE